jgi:serine protease Do
MDCEGIMKGFLKIALLAGLFLALAAGGSTVLAGKKSTPWLGVYTQTVDEELAEVFELPIDHGAIINRVVEDSPADAAGLAEDDVIVLFEGEPVDDSEDLTRLVRASEPEEEVTLTIQRGDDRREVTVTLGSRASRRDDHHAFFYGPGNKHYRVKLSDSRPYVGIAMSDLSDQLGEYFGVEDGQGALVTEVEEDSPAHKAGMKAGDVIVAIDDEKTAEPGDVRKIVLDQKEGDTIEFELLRNKRDMSLKVEVAEREQPHWAEDFNLAPDDLTTLDWFVPHLKGLADEDLLLDREKLDDEMENLQEQLEQLKKELQELKEELD